MIDHEGQVWLTYAEAAQEAGLKEATVRQWVRRGKAKAHRIGKVSYVRMADLADAEHRTRGQYLAQRQSECHN